MRGSAEEKALILVLDGEMLNAMVYLETFTSVELCDLERAGRELSDLCTEERLNRMRRGDTA